jgi:hypothetical protein
MAELDTRGQLTLLELAKRTNNGNLIAIAEVMDETNDILKDAVWVEANQLTSHLITRRHSLPSGSWRRLNAGVAPESSATSQFTEAIGMLEAYSEVDKKLVDIAPNPKQFRADEDMAFIEGMSQNVADTLIYGNMATHPERFYGLATRYNDLSCSNVFSAGGSGSDLTSIWVVQWGVRTVHLIYPKNSKTLGIQARDLGEDTTTDANGNKYQIYRTHFTIDVGLAIRDERCVQRQCNIETSGASNLWSDDLLIEMLNNLPYGGKGAVIYCNKTIKTQMDIEAKDKSNVNYTAGNAFGVPTTYFRGVPVRQVDAILNTESEVT